MREKLWLNKFKYTLWLGIWADDSDNEDSGSKSYVSKRRPKNYSAPIDFVAGGVQQAGKKDKENENIKEKEESEDDAPTSSFKTRDSSDESEEELPRAGQLSQNNQRNNL